MSKGLYENLKENIHARAQHSKNVGRTVLLAAFGIGALDGYEQTIGTPGILGLATVAVSGAGMVYLQRDKKHLAASLQTDVYAFIEGNNVALNNNYTEKILNFGVSNRQANLYSLVFAAGTSIEISDHYSLSGGLLLLAGSAFFVAHEADINKSVSAAESVIDEVRVRAMFDT